MNNPNLPSPRRIKLLLIDNSLHFTGAFKSALAIADAVRPKYDIEFLLSTQSTLRKDVEMSGLVCHQLPLIELGRSWKKLLRYIPQLLMNTVQLRRILSRQDVDILLINDYYNLLGATTKMTGWSGRLFTMVRLLPMNQHRVLNRIWSTLAIMFSSGVIAVSQAVCKQLPTSDKIQVIYNPSRFIDEYTIASECAVQDGIVRCLYLANYISGKGHADALQAFSRAYAINPALRLRFMGGDMGLEKNMILKKNLEATSKVLGLSDVVAIEGFSNDVATEMNAADIFLNFSESESFSNTCLEASAYGLPVIASCCGGPEEIVKDGVSGLLVPVGDVDAMTSALLMLSLDGNLRKMMGRAGIKIVGNKFSKRKFIFLIRKLYEF